MSDPYEVDDEGIPVEEESAVEAPLTEADPAAADLLRRQVEATLRFMALSTVVGLVIIAILAIVLSDIRGVMILVGIVYLLTSVSAYWYLRRTLSARLQRATPPSAS